MGVESLPRLRHSCERASSCNDATCAGRNIGVVRQHSDRSCGDARRYYSAEYEGSISALREKIRRRNEELAMGKSPPLTLQHPFGLQKPLDKIFSIGPFPYGGGSTAMMSGEYSFNEALLPAESGQPFGVTVGASFRHIVDMSKPYEYVHGVCLQGSRDKCSASTMMTRRTCT